MCGTPGTREVVLKLRDVISHPQFKIGQANGPKEGPYSGFDLAVYKVHDSELKAQMERRKLWPACLPRQESSYEDQRGLWAGWDGPDMRNITTNAINIPTQLQLEAVPCKDPDWMGSDSFYPAGTQCFQDPTFFSCYCYGNAGSGVVRRFSTFNGTDR